MDLSDYLINTEIARTAVRTAEKYNAPTVEWQDFIDRIKQNKSEE